MSDYETCAECSTYAEARMQIFVPSLSKERAKTGETGEEIVDRYMSGVHYRHLAGFSLAVTK